MGPKPPTNLTRSTWFYSKRTDVPAQLSHRPLSSRLIDVAALVFLRGLALADWVKRRVRW